MAQVKVSTNGSGSTRAAPTSSRRRRSRRRPITLPSLTGRDVAIEVVERKVEDPYQPGTQIRTSFNRRVDVLEEELSNGRIAPSAYLVGRIVQAIYEKIGGSRLGSGGWNPGNRIDADTAKEISLIRGIEDARIVKAMADRVERAVGTVGARFLRAVLVEQRTLSQYAAERGKAGERGTSQVGAHFRLLLEGLDDAFAARGKLTMVEDAQHGSVPAIRAHRTSGGEEVETDVNGIVVPTGQGYRLGNDPAMRWRPRSATRRA